MAVLRTLKGVEVKVKVDGFPVAEYDTDDQEPNCCTKYIESEPGLNFSVEVFASRNAPFPKHAIGAEISVDGTLADTVLIVRAKSERRSKEILGLKEKIGDKERLHKFRFKALETSRPSLFSSSLLTYIKSLTPRGRTVLALADVNHNLMGLVRSKSHCIAKRIPTRRKMRQKMKKKRSPPTESRLPVRLEMLCRRLH
jgi:hypothetical protein